ncbi:hypothetical protein ACLMJK_008855 [Lecanora helva]
MLSDSRSAYIALKEHFVKSVKKVDDLSAEDPLIDTETSPWNTLRQDEELRAEIFLDVERCMPEVTYFREPPTQNMLLDILFIYCKLNQDIGYRQGMHEVLAPILWVVSRDAMDPQSKDQINTNLDGDMLSILDGEFVEHDAFTLFGAIMQTVKSSYEVGNSNDPKTASSLVNNSPIVERSKRIHEIYLHHADPELAEHLTAIEILPQIFLIRWIRLLFGREFPFEDVLALWDALFAEDPGLDLVDMIAVAMLLRIRWQLLEADYSAALTLLLRYPTPPPPHGPATFVGDASYLRDNLQLDGGDHIISKYTRRAPETTVTRKLPKKIRRARTAEQEAAQSAPVPRTKNARMAQGQGGIEAIIHEAAKGVYSRGEKWGVGKALRGAVQGLQSGHSSPRTILERPKQSLDPRRIVSDQATELDNKVQALEQRNKSLAKLLENAVSELWSQQKQLHEDNDESVADALGLSIAKVQFVQVYLENSMVPLPSDTTSSSENPDSAETHSLRNEPHASTAERESRQDAAQTDGSIDEKLPKSIEPGIADSSSRSDPQGGQRDSPPSTPKKGRSPVKTSSPPPRPSLEKSPFSWMLGEDQRKSEFVAASPFRSGNKSARPGNLFSDTGGSNRTTSSNRDRRTNAQTSNADNDDVFTVGLLKGRRPER